MFSQAIMALKCLLTLLYFYYNFLSPKTNWKHVVAAYFMYILIFHKIGRHVGGHLGFLGRHHDSSQSPLIFFHLRHTSNHLCNHFLWTVHAHRHPLRDWSTIDFIRPFCWTTFLFDLAPSSIDKLLGFLWALIVLPWLQIYSCFVMKGTL